MRSLFVRSVDGAISSIEQNFTIARNIHRRRLDVSRPLRKILNGIPRHRLIVARIVGERFAGVATVAIGTLELLLGIWVLTGQQRALCAIVQTLAIASMNILEILFARDLLISAAGMVVLNLAFLSLVWYWAFAAP